MGTLISPVFSYSTDANKPDINREREYVGEIVHIPSPNSFENEICHKTKRILDEIYPQNL